jgi:geranylgeranyl reductase family protein
MEKFDVIVIGAGTGGCLTAITAAKAGLKVCLIDRKPREEIGEKICGDAVGKHHFDNLGLAYPKGEELGLRIAGVKIYSPDMKTVFEIKEQQLYGFILNRRMFGQRLVNEATDAGATLLDSTIIIEPTLKDGFVAGVTAKNTLTQSKTQLQSKVVVDASGFNAVLRKKLPPQIGIDLHVDNEDIEACHREIRQLKSGGGLDVETEFLELYLDMNVTPGGYTWIFPEGENKVNVGLGVVMKKGFPNPKTQLYTHVLSKPKFEGSTILNQGTWYLPTRRPLDCMTGNGVLVVGDAACQVNPVHGGGMGPSMTGGVVAGQVIAEALEKDDFSRAGLWQYNVRYMRAYGAKQAGLDIFRLFLLNRVGNEEINYGMKYKLITQEDVLQVSQGQDLHLNITEKTRRAFRGFGKLGMLIRLRDAAHLLKKMKSLYRNYPESPAGFAEWQKKTQEIMNEANRRLGGSQA